ncbi:MAG: D-alanine--D-alanine ligase [bacterium]|nr:D-alanine--D-alanine ligase [bacterium]
MENRKVSVAILFGGMSAEHEVSLKSAAALYSNMDKEKFIPFLIYIDKNGKWHQVEADAFMKGDYFNNTGNDILPWSNETPPIIKADIYFPMLHGPNGEDGKIQGLLEMAGIPYVGADYVSSTLAMDKTVSKILFREAGLNVGDYLVFKTKDFENIKSAVSEHLGYPVFVKPSSMGSSVGITKAENQQQLKAAVDKAFLYDRKILVEKALDIREIEVSVMGNDKIKISRPGELIPHNDFYDYKDKYIDGKTLFHMPAHLDTETEQKIRRIAGEAYKSLSLNGMSRVDLFIEKQTGKIFVNEINTIPGFTEISMFPKLWELDNISFTQLISQLVDYGFQYHAKHKASTDFS